MYTQAARRAVDTLISVTQEVTENINIDKIMPSGFSKVIFDYKSNFQGCVPCNKKFKTKQNMDKQSFHY